MKTGEVVGEIINEVGAIVETRSFGEMTEEEFRRVLKFVQREYPDLAPDDPIEFIGN
jgi:hypothetical protein